MKQHLHALFLYSWRDLGPPIIVPSPTMLINFNSISFISYEIITSFPIELLCKTVFVEVKVVKAPLDYNFL